MIAPPLADHSFLLAAPFVGPALIVLIWLLFVSLRDRLGNRQDGRR